MNYEGMCPPEQALSGCAPSKQQRLHITQSRIQGCTERVNKYREVVVSVADGLVGSEPPREEKAIGSGRAVPDSGSGMLGAVANSVTELERAVSDLVDDIVRLQSNL